MQQKLCIFSALLVRDEYRIIYRRVRRHRKISEELYLLAASVGNDKALTVTVHIGTVTVKSHRGEHGHIFVIMGVYDRIVPREIACTAAVEERETERTRASVSRIERAFFIQFVSLAN